ncbi:hypothetical protein B0H11DRAFT_1754616, partial [Mycena galericulata]
LYRAAAGNAIHDSEDRSPQPRCHPETRKEMLKDEFNSFSSAEEASNSSSDHPSSPILWLHGPAGAGKSAIAQSLCEMLEEEACLGASFFFKRGDPFCGHSKRLFATIAYQLALHWPDLKRHISQSVENDPSLLDKVLPMQLQRLIIEPCRQMGSTPALVVIIDGLDDCKDPNIQQNILQLISHAVHEEQLPLRFLVASRPEPHIREIFSGALNGIHCPVNVKQSFEDVRTYLLDEFARIHQEHRETMLIVPYPWPSQEIIGHLVRKSSGYFIYASTIVQFIGDKSFRPTERLEVIMGIKEPDCGGPPFAALDRLYTEILSQAHARPEVSKILTVIAELGWLGPSHIEQFLKLELGDLQLALRGLHSVINIQEGTFVDFHHASFRDFLQDPARAGKFYIGSHSNRTDLCRHILKALSYRYDDPSANRRGLVR